ncbi:hypothetical protein MUP77_16030 [Candidatus Bathyarchaeota archaeon]|nr:hypothetical protein [Candidatus Bathyarchaeota archaeon]
MPARITDERRKRVIDYRRKGLTYQQIASKLGINVASAYNIVRAESATIPDFEELRELGLSLKKAGVNIEEAKEAVDLLQRIKTLGIPLEILPEAISFYEQQAKSLEDLISIGQRLKDLTKQYGKSPREIIAETKASAERLGSARKDISDGENRVRDLQIQIICLKALLELQNKLSEHGITIGKMDNFIAQNSRLLELGFTPDIADLFATEIKKYDLDNKTAAGILAGDIFESTNLKKALNDQRKVSQDLKEEIRKNTDENNRLKTQYITLQGQINESKANYENEEMTQKQTLKQFESDIDAAKTLLEDLTSKTEDVKIIRATLISNLEKIERIVETNEYLKTITILMAESPISLDWKTVQKASVPFLNGFIRYLQANKNVLFYSSIMSNAMTLRKILEEWARYDSRLTI